MRLYIVRHAIAVPRGTPGIHDNDRALTEEGMEKMRRAAAGLRALKIVPELLLSSPLARAAQTAEILLEAFGKSIELRMVPALAPYGEREDLYRDIRSCNKKLKSLMIVGHQPSLGEIAGEIAFGSPDHYIELKKGGACAIELEIVRGTPKGNIVWLLTPSILRSIAGRK
jgi:phosphohistidine phosphatase